MPAPARTLLTLLLLSLALLGQAAQAFDLTDANGQRHTLAGYQGKYVLVNLWAPWCAPCVAELPDLQALAKSRSDLVVLGVDADGRDARCALQFAAKLGVTYPIVTGQPGIARQFGMRAYPTTLIYDRSGRLVRTLEGRISPAEIGALLDATEVASQ